MPEDAREDVFLSLHLPWPSISLAEWSLQGVLQWVAQWHWHQWLLALKLLFVSWTFTVTVVLPSIYMKVMLFTDEMTSRSLPLVGGPPTNLWATLEAVDEYQIPAETAMRRITHRNWKNRKKRK